MPTSAPRNSPAPPKSPFWFTPGSALFGQALGARAHATLIPSAAEDRLALFAALSDDLAFPAGPPRSWDGLAEALRDLRWLACDAVILLHRGLPRLPDSILAGYLDTLLRAAWDRPTGVPKLHIVFPLDTWVDVDSLLP